MRKQCHSATLPSKCVRQRDCSSWRSTTVLAHLLYPFLSLTESETAFGSKYLGHSFHATSDWSSGVSCFSCEKVGSRIRDPRSEFLLYGRPYCIRASSFSLHNRSTITSHLTVFIIRNWRKNRKCCWKHCWEKGSVAGHSWGLQL